MIGNFFVSSSRGLSPQKQLEIVKFYLEKARTTKDPVLALAVGDDAQAGLSRVKRAIKKATATPQSAADQTLRDGVASAYLEHSKLLEILGYSERAQVSYKKAEKWGHRPCKSLGPAVSSATSVAGSHISWIPDDIFPLDKHPPAFKCTLPDADERLSDTSQLAYCLSLLKVTLSPDQVLEPTTRNWVQVTGKNTKEKERLRMLATDLIRAFTRDEIRDTNAVAEVVCLAPVLYRDEFNHLLKLFVDGVDKSSLLDEQSLEGLAQLMQNAPSGYLNADDLVRILNNLNTRLQDTHGQSSDHIYHLTIAVSKVLDAMADTKVSGVNRIELHEPLSAYLDGLRGSSDPYLVYQAAYAFQALQCVPDNESPLQATMRRVRIVVTGFSGMVSAVKGLDVNGFIEGLGHLQEGLGEVIQVAKIGYENVSALAEGGRGLLESLKAGWSFNRKRAWYTALRGADKLIKDGHLAKFKTLVCEAPCRHDVAFQLGICQRLGDLAANIQWDIESRQGAVAFLSEIYQNDSVWGQQILVKQWILHTLMELASTFGSDLPGVELMLQELEFSGDKSKRAIYRESQTGDRGSHRLKVVSSPPSSPSLLDRVQNKPDIETDLRRLRRYRVKDRGSGVYIPPQAKATSKDPDDMRFPLMERVEEFLSSEQKVMLLLGDSGAGKSTFNRQLECALWDVCNKKEDRIPLYINLPAIDKPEQNLIEKHLRRNDFMEPQIRELKSRRQFILICDGYDESQQMRNLYTSNQLNEKGQWRVQMVISCRSEYLPQNYKDRFQPKEQRLFQQAVVAPFSVDQIRDYVVRYVIVSRPLWQAKDYLKALHRIPDLMELVKNPFLLTLSLEVLPRMMDREQDVLTAQITRVALYDQFVEQWLERGKKRLSERSDLSDQAMRAFERLTDEGFTRNGLIFARDLAGAIYKNQGGNPVVEYSHKRDCNTWKGSFFNRDDENQLLLEACPLTRNGNQHRFVHRSLLEYCFTRMVFEPQETKKIFKPTTTQGRRRSVSSMFSFEDRVAPEEDSVDIEVSLDDHPLTWRNFAGESSIIQFLADRAQHEHLFKKQLFGMVERSITDQDARKAAANAITILVRAGIPFIGADLKGIQIPGADLSGGQFDSAQLQGADLRKTKLHNVWLRLADLSNAQMAGIKFGESPYLQEEGQVASCAFSPDGKTCAVALTDGKISIYDTSSWAKTRTLLGHTSGNTSVTGVAYSPSGLQIASCGSERTVQLWDMPSNAPGLILNGHILQVNSVAYSPCGQQIATGSKDKTVRLWDAHTGTPGSVLSGHTKGVTCVAYLPSGKQITSGSADETVRLWDAQTGASGPILSGHTGWVTSVAYSLSGQQIASGSRDKTVRLWDAGTGVPGPILSGHTAAVLSVVYSPSGHQIASGSVDRTVRLWDAKTGAPGPIFGGHTGFVMSVVYSPSGQQIASGSRDKTLRLWNVQSGAPGPILSSHTDCVTSVAYSSSDKQIASSSWDKTLRLWDAQTGAPGHICRGHTERIYSVVYSPSGQQIATGSADKMVQLWDAQTGAPGPILSGHTDKIKSVAYSPSGQQIASGSYDATVRLWDAQTGAPRLILRGHMGWIASVAYSPNGHQIASGSYDRTLRLWDTKTGASGSILRGHTNTIRSVAYSPSGQQIASGSEDTMVRLWDAQIGTPTLILSGHTNLVSSVAYSPNSQQIASGSSDRTVRLWDIDSGQCLAVAGGFNGCVTSIAWNTTPNGTFFATGCEDASVRMWQVIEDGGNFEVKLCWSTMHDSLVVLKTCIQKVQGLSRTNAWLLEQRGAVDKPTLPLSLREANRMLISVGSVIPKVKTLPNKSVFDGLPMPMASSSAAQSEEPVDSTNISNLKRYNSDCLREASNMLTSVEFVVSEHKSLSSKSMSDTLPTLKASSRVPLPTESVDSASVSYLQTDFNSDNLGEPTKTLTNMASLLSDLKRMSKGSRPDAPPMPMASSLVAPSEEPLDPANVACL